MSDLEDVRAGWALLRAVAVDDREAADALLSDRLGATSTMTGLSIIALAMLHGAAVVRGRDLLELIDEALAELRHVTSL